MERLVVCWAAATAVRRATWSGESKVEDEADMRQGVRESAGDSDKKKVKRTKMAVNANKYAVMRADR
jgi:hypothetical protein